MSKSDHFTDKPCPNCTALENENILLREQLREMQLRAHYDVLTDLPNRRFFIEALENRINRCLRYGDNTALLFLDVDNLKTVNDTHGHAAGDALLIRLGQILSSHIRSADMVARIGGDEYAMLLDNLDADQVEKKIEFLMNRIGQANYQFEGQELKLSASFGFCFIGPKDNVEDLMSRADASMYQAKRAL